MIYSGTSANEPDIHKCTGMTIVVTLEAFVGVLYAAFCGAVVYAKVSRTQSVAQVVFSSPIVIRYGTGVSIETTNQNNASMVSSFGQQQQQQSQQPPSVLGGSIMGKEEKMDDTTTTTAVTTTNNNNIRGDEKKRVPRKRIKQVSDNSVTDMRFLQDTQRLPCPILEFRIANRLSNVDGGELLDAAVNIVASIDAAQACHTVHTAMMKKKKRRRKKKMGRGGGGTGGGGGGRHEHGHNNIHHKSMALGHAMHHQQHWTMDREEYLSYATELLGTTATMPTPEEMAHSMYSSWTTTDPTTSSFRHRRNNNHNNNNSLMEPSFTPGQLHHQHHHQQHHHQPNHASQSQHDNPRRLHQSFEEDPTGHLVPRRIFSKLDVDTYEHPFLEHVWTIRHTLDDRSPLLRTAARDMIQANGGFWPMELNSANGVRSAMHFDQILVSLSGTSNADANAVYAQHVYEWVDLNVGYRFVNMLYRMNNQRRQDKKKKNDNNDENDEMVDTNNDNNDWDMDEPQWRVDLRLINDVTEQAGGGGEAMDGVYPGDTLGDRIADMADMLIL